jgi:hypothetical protein
MTQYVGIALAAVVLVAVAAGLSWTWRRPFVGLGLLVAGLALHNIVGLALVPITMTTDLWGDLSVTFLFWWSAGASATLCAERAWRPARAAYAVRRRVIAGN